MKKDLFIVDPVLAAASTLVFSRRRRRRRCPGHRRRRRRRHLAEDVFCFCVRFRRQRPLSTTSVFVSAAVAPRRQHPRPHLRTSSSFFVVLELDIFSSRPGRRRRFPTAAALSSRNISLRLRRGEQQPLQEDNGLLAPFRKWLVDCTSRHRAVCRTAC